MNMDTKLIHGGKFGDEHTGAVSVPIYQVSTYRQVGIGVNKGYDYSRTSNPTREALELLIADLEKGKRGLAFASGMAAISTVLSLFSHGDHLILGDDIYGGTYRVVDHVFKRFGMEVSYIDTSDIDQLTQAINDKTKAILIETPTNPLLKVTDIAAVAQLCRQHNCMLIVDNTFLTPYWQNPLDMGADIVLHSATKFLGGHSDVVAGLIVTRTEELGDKLHFLQKSIGGVLGPHDSWLLIRGIKTLGLRMARHEKSSREIAEWLNKSDLVEKVYYPGLKNHPQYELSSKQARGYGGIISFDVGSKERLERIIKKLKIISLAESLGAVESLLSIPAYMTHSSIPEERRMELGISNGLARLSVGIEDVQDLIEELKLVLS